MEVNAGKTIVWQGARALKRHEQNATIEYIPALKTERVWLKKQPDWAERAAGVRSPCPSALSLQ